MNRDELYMVKTYKLEELKKRLKPIDDWSEVKQGQQIFNNNDNDIWNNNVFLEYDKVNNFIRYMVYDTSNSINEEYILSATGWYYYDESIADEVEEYFTPKLFIINSIKYKEDYWFVVAFNEKYLKQEFLKSMHMEGMTDLEFEEKYEYEILNNVDGFDIILK